MCTSGSAGVAVLRRGVRVCVVRVGVQGNNIWSRWHWTVCGRYLKGVEQREDGCQAEVWRIQCAPLVTTIACLIVAVIVVVVDVVWVQLFSYGGHNGVWRNAR
jgi:hypothetical protein